MNRSVKTALYGKSSNSGGTIFLAYVNHACERSQDAEEIVSRVKTKEREINIQLGDTRISKRANILRKP